jgi:hypothetical protein
VEDWAEIRRLHRAEGAGRPNNRLYLSARNSLQIAVGALHQLLDRGLQSRLITLGASECKQVLRGRTRTASRSPWN